MLTASLRMRKTRQSARSILLDPIKERSSQGNKGDWIPESRTPLRKVEIYELLHFDEHGREKPLSIAVGKDKSASILTSF